MRDNLQYANLLSLMVSKTLAERHHKRAPSDGDDATVSTSQPLQLRENRHGRAPPVDKFTGEDPSIELNVGMTRVQWKS